VWIVRMFRSDSDLEGVRGGWATRVGEKCVSVGRAAAPESTTNDASDQNVCRKRWVDRALSNWWCGLGWVIATTVLLCVTRLLGGPASADSGQSSFSVWAFAHGVPSCAYPPSDLSGVAPLYPIVSGGVAAVARIGHGVAFPTSSSVGPNCSTAIKAMAHWSNQAGAVGPTIRIGYLGWLVLMAGVVAFLRTTNRGKCGWEPLTLVLMACAPLIFLPIQEFFHPEDLVAMGLGLGGLACARRGWWVGAGLLLGLAVMSQQFALLIAGPLFVIAPTGRRLRYSASAIGAASMIIVPLMFITSGRVIKAIAGAAATPPAGSSIVAGMHLHGPVVFTVSRLAPIALAMALAYWAGRRLGDSMLEPTALASLVATSLALRLVFEISLYGYYFMALTVMLILLDILRGRIRLSLVAWIGLGTLAFDPYFWTTDPLGGILPVWLLQVVFVPMAVIWALGPLVASMGNRSQPESDVKLPDVARVPAVF
jgi:hypothetical protein